MIQRVKEGSADEKARALSAFCETYWSPVYAFILAQGSSSQDSEDLTQDYFRRLLNKGTLEKAFQERGKLRGFLKADIRFYLRDAWARRTAEKRGGGQVRLSIDHDNWDASSHERLTVGAAPDEVFDREWGMALLNSSLDVLETQFRLRDRGEVFLELKGFLLVDGSGDYSQSAEKLGMTVTTIRAAVHRMRSQFRNILREQVSATVSDPAEVLGELRYLQQLYSA